MKQSSKGGHLGAHIKQVKNNFSSHLLYIVFFLVCEKFFIFIYHPEELQNILIVSCTLKFQVFFGFFGKQCEKLK